MNTILVIGQNPSKNSPHLAFWGTKSGDRLCSWLNAAGMQDCVLSNISNDLTEDNKPLKMSEIKRIARSEEFKDKLALYDKVVPVGKQAALCVAIACVHHGLSIRTYEVPHPSGKNRKLNEPGIEKKIIRALREFGGRDE